MRPLRLGALILGSLLLLPALGLFLGGGALGLGWAFSRDDDGYFDVALDEFDSPTAAIVAEDVGFYSEPGSPAWLIDTLDADLRLRATSVDSGLSNGSDIFIGIGPEADVETYLAETAHDEITDLTDDWGAVYQRREGSASAAPPGGQDFWVASASGSSTQQLDWQPTVGRFAAVIMNADGSPGVRADVNVGAKAGVVLPLAGWLLGIGAVLTMIATTVIVVGATGSKGVEPNVAGGSTPYPVVMTAELDPELSRWQWLVKWILAIPHFIVLVFLWIAFWTLTVVAAIAIVITGRYPRNIFDFNVGVMRWSWRVAYYAHSGGLGTDRYPPFSLDAQRGDLATLDVEYPERLSRGLVFVKWLLALPHLIIVALLAGSSVRWISEGGFGFDVGTGGGLIGLLVLVAGVILLVTDRYPPSLFDLIIGLNRWVYRTLAYVALMTDRYPPFRLDQGGDEPTSTPAIPMPPAPTPAAVTAPAPEPSGPGGPSTPEPAQDRVVDREPASV